MSERKGLISEAGHGLLGTLLDEAIPFKNPVLEAFDGKAFTIVIAVVDDNLIDKIPEDWKNPLEPIVDAAINSNWELAGTLAASMANEKIDIPGLDELSEQLIFSGVVQLIVGLIQGKVESVQKEEEEDYEAQ